MDTIIVNGVERKIGYKRNEWIILYSVDGKREIEVLHEYENAIDFSKEISERDTHNLIGIVTTMFYKHYLNNWVNED